MSQQALRVFQFATGNVGTEMVGRIVGHPDLELVDLFCTLFEAGINVVTTSDWITGYHRDRNHPHPSGKKPTELRE